MIVKIWGIKAGGKKGLTNSINYITDEKKVEGNISLEQEIDYFNNNSLTTSLNYINDQEKIKQKYVSGYLCDVDFAVEQFIEVKERNLNRVGKTIEDDKGIIAHHIVQSFPADLDISDELVHKCGQELAEKIGLYQAIIVSHVNPVIIDGSVTGQQKHNHIIINSHTIDPIRQHGSIHRMKYYDNKASYALLRQYNDEIALKYNLPIIENKSKNKGKSYAEIKAIRENVSWKQQIREDIDEVKKESKDWDSFIAKMKKKGYVIKENKYVVYRKQAQERGSRDKSLGIEYTKERIINYFKEQEKLKECINEEVEKNNNTSLLRNNNDIYVSNKYNSKTKKRYKLEIYTSNRRRRSAIEMLLYLAIIIIKNEYEIASSNNINFDNKYSLGKRDWKMQQMMEAIEISRKENVNKIEDIKDKQNKIGTEISKIKAAIKRNNITHNKMYAINIAIKNFEKLDKSTDYEEINKAKAVLERYKITTDKDIEDFKGRYKGIKDKIVELEDDLQKTSERYKNLKKLEYRIKLAEDNQFLYEHSYKKENTLEERINKIK